MTEDIRIPEEGPMVTEEGAINLEVEARPGELDETIMEIMKEASELEKVAEKPTRKRTRKTSNEPAVSPEMEEALNDVNVPAPTILEDPEGEEERRRVFISDDFDNVLNPIHPDDELKLKWADVVQAAKRKTLKECEILGAAIRTADREEDRYVYAISKINDFRVIIPADDFFLPGTSPEGKDKHTRQLQMLQRMIGSRIQVVITGVVSVYGDGRRTYGIKASRVLACEVVQNIYFWGRTAKRRTPHVGDSIMARILSVGTNSVLVQALGVETRLNYGMLTGRRSLNAENVLDHFPKDRGIYMKIVDMQLDPETKKVEWKLSHRALEDETYDRKLTDEFIGRRLSGEVISVNDNYYICYAEGENVRCVCPIQRCLEESRLKRGDKVVMEVYGVDPEGRYLRCNSRKLR